ncbi:MAG TPA: DUF5658 family protein [Bryobacteraceae bacterium]|nr:DUF5658 family protein [Bryobacteraceae bacterium]
MTHAFVQYSYLQLLDLLTTVAFLLHGVQEGNPLVRYAIEASPNPLIGLLGMKFLAILLGIYCWRTQKLPMLRRVNLFFALLVAWNLVSLIVGGVLPSGLT